MVYIKLEELEIKAIADADEDAVIALLTDNIVKQTYMLPDFADRAQAAALFRRLRDMSNGDEHLVSGIYLNGNFVGLINETEKGNCSIELGYALLPEHHGKGYCTRALRAYVDYLFSIGYERILCGAFEDNIASIRVMEKCGMSRIDKTDIISYRGKNHRCVYYEK